MMFQLVEPDQRLARIRVVGVGGAGGNAVNRMVEAGLEGVDFLAVNTDLQALRGSLADQTLQIGREVTRGLGSGGDPEVGRQAVAEDQEELADLFAGSDMIFVTAGMGGGTGTGAAPVVARVARDSGALTVGIVTKPFHWEGSVRMRQAEAGLEAMREAVDTLIVIPNQRLLEVVPPSTSMSEAFRIADNVLYEATRSIHDIIMKPHQVNLDFADVRSIMAGMGVALMGSGTAAGENRAEEAARQALHSPLLEDVEIRGAQGVLVNLTSGDIALQEAHTVMTLVQEAAGDQAHIIFGYGTDPELGETLRVSVIATGFPQPAVTSRPRAMAAQAGGATVLGRPTAPAIDPDPARNPAPAAVMPPAAEVPPADGTPAGPAAPPPDTREQPLVTVVPDPAPHLRPVQPAGREWLGEASPSPEPDVRRLDSQAGTVARPVQSSRRGWHHREDPDLTRPAYTRKYVD